MQVQQGSWQIASELLQACPVATLPPVIGNQLLCFRLQISLWKWCCKWLVLILICFLCYWHLFHWEIFQVVCGHCILWFQLPGSNSSILWLHNTHCKLFVLWCSISIVCPWRYVKEKLFRISFHHVPPIVVLHRHHLMHLYILCNALMDLDSTV